MNTGEASQYTKSPFAYLFARTELTHHIRLGGMGMQEIAARC